MRIFLLILGVLSILCCTCLCICTHVCVHLCTFMYRYHDIFVFTLSFVLLVSSSAVQIYFEIYVSVCSSLLLPVYTILSSMCPHVFVLGSMFTVCFKNSCSLWQDASKWGVVPDCNIYLCMSCISMFNHSSNNYQHQRQSPGVSLQNWFYC